MNYYIDCEFLEGSQLKRFWGIPYAKTKPTIDLISIGIVCEDGREYYAISKDFNLEEAWNRFDWIDTGKPDLPGINRSTEKRYWIRDNVLMPIFYELSMRDFHNTHYKDEWTKNGVGVTLEIFRNNPVWSRDFWWFKKLLKKYGKSNSQIAEEIRKFVSPLISNDGLCNCTQSHRCPNGKAGSAARCTKQELCGHTIEFYGYYSDYDWVVFAWLFGKMIDLPKGFPMYCRDLKQELDKEVFSIWLSKRSNGSTISFEEQLSIVKSDPRYPRETNEHNALVDARWNKRLHRFIMAT